MKGVIAIAAIVDSHGIILVACQIQTIQEIAIANTILLIFQPFMQVCLEQERNASVLEISVTRFQARLVAKVTHALPESALKTNILELPSAELN